MSDATDLDHARHLAKHGVPLFLAEPALDEHGNWDSAGGHHGTGYWLPQGWQDTKPDPAVADRWKPGMALCAVQGDVTTVLDFDPRNGAPELNGMMPRGYGEASTPSGGTHRFVAALGVGSKDGVLPGLDVKSGRADGTGRGFVFLAPTLKLSKVTGAIEPYAWTTPPDLSALVLGDDETGRALAALIEAQRAAGDGSAAYDGPVYAELDASRQAQAAAYVDRQLDAWRDRLTEAADWPEGERDDQGRGWEALARDLAYALARIEVTPWCPPLDAEEAYLEVLPEVMAADPKCRGKWRDDLLEKASVKPADAPPWVNAADEFDVVAEELDEDAFWSAYPVLEHIWTFALSRMCSPWAVLGVCLLRVLHYVPPSWTLPPIIGGKGSLNMFLALCARSGGGKTSSEEAATDCLIFDGVVEPVYVLPVGSGEGLTRHYAHRDRKSGIVMRDREAILWTAAEVDTLTSLGGRPGATLLPALRDAFSGAALGYGYADPTKAVVLERHSYRFGFVVGVQDRKAGALFNDTDAGTPQRLLWLRATDPKVTATPPPAPEPYRVPLALEVSGDRTLPVPETVAAIIREAHAARQRGEGEALDGHALYVRLKVAQALAFLDGREVMTEQDWELAGVVAAVSDRTRAEVQAEVRKRDAEGNHQRGLAAGMQQVTAADVVAERSAQRVAQRLRAVITEAAEPVSRKQLRARLASRDREYLDDALAKLAAVGDIALEKGERGGERYRSAR